MKQSDGTWTLEGKSSGSTGNDKQLVVKPTIDINKIDPNIINAMGGQNRTPTGWKEPEKIASGILKGLLNKKDNTPADEERRGYTNIDVQTFENDLNTNFVQNAIKNKTFQKYLPNLENIEFRVDGDLEKVGANASSGFINKKPVIGFSPAKVDAVFTACDNILNMRRLNEKDVVSINILMHEYNHLQDEKRFLEKDKYDKIVQETFEEIIIRKKTTDFLKEYYKDTKYKDDNFEEMVNKSEEYGKTVDEAREILKEFEKDKIYEKIEKVFKNKNRDTIVKELEKILINICGKEKAGKVMLKLKEKLEPYKEYIPD